MVGRDRVFSFVLNRNLGNFQYRELVMMVISMPQHGVTGVVVRNLSFDHALECSQ